ncbi:MULTISPECIES: hypothetical protein [unclassified Duganella]|uniref:hypothetical protein n=1 Tax=unclassified Duganella TaxID=2636909 RepID=UPI0006F4FB2B|nr:MULTISPECIES: hypothetical protein [unclassified Duganella]KQV61558.1 hypothetical protein ASD07_01525 [Duganella sp. Root336D2]KRB92622.1 hypothetical protein ASE26_05045 [Duganella sp. Root198D2]
MKKLMALMAFTLAMAGGQAMAHESPAKHGGIVKSAGDMSFELVNKDGQTTIYVDDHGKEVAMAGGSGTLTVLKGTEKSEAPLTAGSGNTLVAKTGDKVTAGTKVVAAIVFPDKSTMSVRFSIK